MTTTPTASPELPGLDNLEAQARAADQDGQHIYTNPHDSNNWRANEIWHYLASPAAVLALIALARRAQPASEATQTACTVPPEGWYCTRAPGHDGPCAAWPVAQQDAAPSNSPEIPDGSTSAPGTPEAPKQPAHGHRDDYYLLANGRRLGLESISRVRNMPNWVLAMELFATGSTSAHQICHDAGIDPDSTTIQRAAAPKGGS